MSKKLFKAKLFELKEFQQASRLEKLYMHLLQPYDFILTDQEEEHLDRLKSAFNILSNTMSKAVAVNQIQAIHPFLERSSAYKIINDCQELFGNILETNKKFDRMVLTEKLARFVELHEGAKGINPVTGEEYDAPNLEEARKCIEAIAKIKGLDKADSTDPDPDTLKMPQIIFSSDPRLLSQAEEIEIDEED